MFEIYYAEIDSDICCCGVNFERIRDESALMPKSRFKIFSYPKQSQGFFLKIMGGWEMP